ncbi:MAG: PEGA domain-containing protein [Candidatus Paceibacterota bacterium]
MTKRTRTLLFIFLVIVFFFVGPSIIMYSQGYRFDFHKMKYLETGGIYVKTYPGDADVSIDDDYKNRTSGFSRDLLIQNLLPENHTVKIEKEGYYSWQKTLEVKEKTVSEAKYVIMFSKENPFASIDNDIKNFYPLPDGNKFILLTLSNELFSYDAEKKELKKLFNNKQTPYNISDIVFSPSGKKAYIKTESGLHYLLNLETPALSLIKNFSSKTKNIFFDPNDEGSFFYQSNNYIFKVNVEKKTDAKLFKKEKVDAFTLVNDYLYSLENGEVVRTNILLNTTEKITAEPFKINTGNQYKLVSMENELFLIENGKTIYLLNKETKNFDKIIEAQSEIKYTPFYDRILFATDNELYLLLLKDTETPFFKKAYSVIFISRFSEKIGDIKWLNGDYFVYTLNDRVNISEIDNRDKINSFNLNKDSSRIFFNGNTKKLFILDQNEFMVSENKVMP